MLLLSRLHSPNTRFILPFVITTLMILSYPLLTPFITTYAQLWIKLPFILLGTVVILNYKLPQAQSGSIAIVMLIAYSVIIYWLQTSLANTDTKLIFCLLATLLPLNLLLLRFIYLPKLFSVATTILLLGLSLQYGITATICYFYQVAFSNWQQTHLFTYHNISSLPLILIIFNLAISCGAGALTVKYHRRIDRHIFICSLLATTTFIFFHYPFISSTTFIICALFLLTDLGYCRYQQNLCDPLTQLADHRALALSLSQLQQDYTIVVIDIDNQAKIIAKHHPQAINDIQRSIAAQLALQSQHSEHLYFVSQQFIMIFEDRKIVECQSIIERLQQDIGAEKYIIEPIIIEPLPDQTETKAKKGRKKTIKVTVSAGISASHVDQSALTVVQQAIDILQAAQQAKKKKNNQIYVSETNNTSS
ncbi:GGDEF domain-containing protein [Photobacterium carnosum]|uniref:GGDEF domain-containing protein n=1 Tax=Photobacterium carnosum TaxID=2023717 RepID=UPI001E311BFA|nr:GGDEF domain-containing protein [Photobacterium carnosum]MCD9497088.1 hypothetical protein [Photobacterium carnosum]MCD9524429.1 hypothetical protein [Photobacterium carnosum]